VAAHWAHQVSQAREQQKASTLQTSDSHAKSLQPGSLPSGFVQQSPAPVPPLSSQPPVALQFMPLGHTPHVFPQPSEPQTLPSHCGTHSTSHWPDFVHASPMGQEPHDPPQLSEPQTLPAQLGTHSHSPWALQTDPPPHVPQVSPHPLGPQFLPSHWGTQAASMHLPLSPQ
jgi:hypothetical protein